MSDQGSQEWLQERCGNFTGSKAHLLIESGKSDEFSEAGLTYILETLGEQFSGIPIESRDSKATLWGKEHEPLAREWYCRKFGMLVEEAGFVKHPDIENFGASSDGLAYKIGSGDDAGILEIKCPFNYSNHLNHCLIDSVNYFKQYFKDKYWQIVANASVHKLKWADFVSFDPRMNKDVGLFCFHVPIPEADILLLESKIKLANERLFQLKTKIENK